MRRTAYLFLIATLALGAGSPPAHSATVPITAAQGGCNGHSEGCGTWSWCSWSFSSAYVDVSGVIVDKEAKPQLKRNSAYDKNCTDKEGGKFTVSNTVEHTVGCTWEWGVTVGAAVKFNIKLIETEVKAEFEGKYTTTSEYKTTFGVSKEFTCPPCSRTRAFVATKVRWDEKAHVEMTMYCVYKLDSDCGFGSCKAGKTSTVKQDQLSIPCTGSYDDNESQFDQVSWSADCPECPCKTKEGQQPAPPEWWDKMW